MKLNDKEFELADLNFHTVCDIQRKYGVDIIKINDQMFPFIEAYIAYSANVSLEDAGKMVDSHLASGGSFNEFVQYVSERIKEGSFFQAASRETAKKEAETNQEAPKVEMVSLQPQVNEIEQLQRL